MKNILLIIITLSFGLAGCELFYDPQAKFEASKTKMVLPYEEIQFYNHSKYANDYEWSFGDGTYSNEYEPRHYYTEPGIYEVRLSAYKDDQESDAYMTIEVIAADLNIQVREFTDRYVIPNARVVLYPTLSDWYNQTNKVAVGYTNQDGIIEFFNLNEGFYYMDISNSTHNNYILANEDVGYIKTPYIAGATTYITAYVDYVGSNKSAKVKRTLMVVPTSRPFKSEMSTRTNK